jgi:hypothetical protein
VEQRDEEHQRRDDDDVAVVGSVVLGDARPAHGLEPREVGGVRPSGEAAAAVREVDRDQHDVHGAGRHQRDQGQVDAGESDRGQADQDPHDAGDRRRHEQQDRERQVRGEVQPGRSPHPDHEQCHLSERDQADPAAEDAEPERDDRVDRDAREGRRPVGADGRQHEEGDCEERGDREPADDGRPVEPDRDARRCGRLGARCRRCVHA